MAVLQALKRLGMVSMTEYCRTWLPGGTWFFTGDLAERVGNRLLVERIELLRTVVCGVQLRHLMRLAAVDIFPDHLHGFWKLPPGDSDFAGRLSGANAAFGNADSGST